MRYQLQQKLFAFGDDFTVKDETGADRYIVDGKVFTLGHRVIIRDMQGSEVATIQQQIISLLPTYEITRSGQEVAEVRKKLTFFREGYTVDIPGPDDLAVQGDLLDHEYIFTRDGQTAATVSKQWFSLADSYGVEVAPGVDDVLILASAVVIDLVNSDQQGAIP
ncbi:MAG TPA: LURP-one-related family protein [Ktedonobacterales bacterium]|nr:LURP-one-related family protein [Ktedonobacterales bacterium]